MAALMLCYGSFFFEYDDLSARRAFQQTISRG
jgi:hypothetical protein